MKLTREQIEAGRSPAGGFRLIQLKTLGVELPPHGWPKKGWIDRLVGTEVSDTDYATFLSLGETTALERKQQRLAALKDSEPTLF